MKNVVNTFEACETATGIPLKIIRRCFKMGAAGLNKNGTCNVVKFQAWYALNKDTVDVKLEDLKIEDKEMDIRLKKLKEKEMERDLISPDEVKQLLVGLATAQSVMIKKIFSEIAPKCAGKSEVDIKIITDKLQQELFDLFQSKTESIVKMNSNE